MSKNFIDSLRAARQESSDSLGGFLVPAKIVVDQRGRLGRFFVRLGLLKPKMKEIDLGTVITNAIRQGIKKPV